jgi:hypothetical protein
MRVLVSASDDEKKWKPCFKKLIVHRLLLVKALNYAENRAECLHLRIAASPIKRTLLIFFLKILSPSVSYSFKKLGLSPCNYGSQAYFP